MSEPCMCGAIDCRRCYPYNFDGEYFLLRPCEKCGCEFWLQDRYDETELCEECRKEAGNE